MAGSESKIVTIDNINGNFYGGVPFVASWNFQNSDQPSTLSISVVNSKGSYSVHDSDLNYSSTVGVSLGNFTFNGYLQSYEIEKSAQQKILHLQYVDKSIDLERWSVGLKNRHFTDSQNNQSISRMIIVGREYGACDKELNSISSPSSPGDGDYSYDKCDPCPQMPHNGYSNACKEELKNLKILPVYYTFRELINKFNQCGLSADFSKVTGGAVENYRAQHVGTLRSVLSAWCAELGYSYYFDPVAN
jgi:hypothetical protein